MEKVNTCFSGVTGKNKTVSKTRPKNLAEENEAFRKMGIIPRREK